MHESFFLGKIIKISTRIRIPVIVNCKIWHTYAYTMKLVRTKRYKLLDNKEMFFQFPKSATSDVYKLVNRNKTGKGVFCDWSVCKLKRGKNLHNIWWE